MPGGGYGGMAGGYGGGGYGGGYGAGSGGYGKHSTAVCVSINVQGGTQKVVCTFYVDSEFGYRQIWK